MWSAAVAVAASFFVVTLVRTRPWLGRVAAGRPVPAWAAVAPRIVSPLTRTVGLVVVRPDARPRAGRPLFRLGAPRAVTGHVAGVVLAHDRAAQDIGGTRAALAQLPMAAVMIGLTVTGLTLLLPVEPLVGDKTCADVAGWR